MPAIELLAASPATLVGTCLLLGLVVGSFLNVVIYRLPIMLERQWREQCAEFSGSDAAAQTMPAVPSERFDLVTPRSSCPRCKARITALQNIPLVSWVLLGGRCAGCGKEIGIRYPLIEGLTGLLTAAVAWRFGFGWPLVAAMSLTWFLIALAFIDIDHQLLPDSLTLPLLWLGLLISLFGPSPGGTTIPVDVRSSLLGAMVGYLSLWTVYHLFRLLTGKEGMGYGDFKLFAALGAWLGWQMLLPALLIAAVLGSVIGATSLSLRGQKHSTPIAFGPFLAVAGWIMLMVGPRPVAAYFGFLLTPP
jgi:leader peptidase (prepilin peptidase) / N-methyltransferase